MLVIACRRCSKAKKIEKLLGLLKLRLQMLNDAIRFDGTTYFEKNANAENQHQRIYQIYEGCKVCFETCVGIELRLILILGLGEKNSRPNTTGFLP